MTDSRTYERRNVFVYGTPFLIGYQNFIKSEIDGRKTRLMTYGPASFVEVAGRRYVRHTSGSGDRTITVDIDPETKLPARWRWQTGSGTYEAVFGNVVLNQSIPNSAFDVPALTAGYTLVPTIEERTLPALGTMGANIQGRTVQGRDFDLLATAATRRATVVAFVNPNDANSANAALGIRNIVGNRRDVEVVYVSSVADREVTQRFLKSARLSNACLIGEPANGAISGYGVRLYPTVVVLDATGKVTSRMLGFDETAFTNAIAATPASSGNAN
ncbi:MAG: hypothetical protein EOP29_29660 [Rhodococcus sp. (in: high G+C Gram-positive bacteria)]|nr:MAG: hypothetical protein EOP29_29660 [Rhodococcus sp. (in: high G+C Gram-positive bacteria)]